jgi:hypothetical protein
MIDAAPAEIAAATISDFDSDFAEPPVPHRPVRTDHAAVVATAITQIIATAAPSEQQAAIEDYLRDEFTELTNRGGSQ